MEYSDYIETRDPAAALTGAELFAFSQAGSSKKDDLAAFAAYMETVLALFGSSEVDVSGAITLDLDNKIKVFKFQSGVSVPKTISFSGSATQVFDIEIIISDIAAVLTWPASVVMPDSRWIAGSNTWTPLETGTYSGHAFTFDGTTWNVTIEQLPNI